MDAAVHRTDASAVMAEQDVRKRNLNIANALSWGEILWIAKKTPIEGNIAALHDRKTVDEYHLPCFLLP